MMLSSERSGVSEPQTPMEQPPDPRRCARCGGELRAAMRLPERAGQPAYDIFRCIACGFMAWFAQGPQLQP